MKRFQVRVGLNFCKVTLCGSDLNNGMPIVVFGILIKGVEFDQLPYFCKPSYDNQTEFFNYCYFFRPYACVWPCAGGIEEADPDFGGHTYRGQPAGGALCYDQCKKSG